MRNVTTKEAMWVMKQTAQGNKVEIKYKGIDCENVLDWEYKLMSKFISESNFENPHKGVYTWYDAGLTQQNSMCVKDKANCIYQCKIENLELTEK